MPSAEPLRTFVAVDFPAAVVARAADVAARLQALTRGVRYVSAAQMHLTLHFYGDLEPAQIAVLEPLLAAETARVAPFEVQVGGLGTFPPRGRPRVVWLGVADASGTLLRLQAGVERATRAAGLPGEDRPFRAHLTLGRVKDEPVGLAEALARLRDPDCGRCLIDALRLIRSELRPAGPRYSTLARFALGGTAAATGATE